MDIEENAQHEEIIKIDVNNIQNEIVESENGYTYYPDQLTRCFIPQTDLAKELTLITLKMHLINMKIKSLKNKVEGADEFYLINKDWYNKWKIYGQ